MQLPGVDAAASGSSGYVTGGEGDEEASYDPSLHDQSVDEGSGGRAARVPFQELIDLSISLM